MRLYVHCECGPGAGDRQRREGVKETGQFQALRLSKRLFRKIPARCPRCGGDAYRTDAMVITYTCRQCNHNVIIKLFQRIRI